MQSNCEPASIYGGFSQHTFLGCSILGMNAEVGWNNEETKVTLQLARDPCAGPKVYYDRNLNRQTTNEPDPGFECFGPAGDEPPNLGSPVYLRIGEFEFCGLLNDWSASRGEGGNPTYTVILSDPRKILAGTQLIIGEYSGTVSNVYNLINCYGYMESYGQYCPFTQINGAYFGTYSDGFGGANTNQRGMQWNRLKQAVSILTSAIPINGNGASNMWSPHGRLVYRGSYAHPNGYGLLHYDRYGDGQGLFINHNGYLSDYFVDLSEVPTAPSYWRLSGANVSLLDAINDVCTDAGCDYYIELVPMIFGSDIIKIIKVRVVSRKTQPTLGTIQTFIDQLSTGVTSNTIGRELRSETNTKFIIGGNVHSIYQVEQSTDPDNDIQATCLPNSIFADDMIVPYFGKDANGNAIMIEEAAAHFNDTQSNWQFDIDCTSLALSLKHAPWAALLAADPIITVREVELRAALGGIDTWMMYVEGIQADIAVTLQNFNNVLDVAALVNGVGKPVRDILKIKDDLGGQQAGANVADQTQVIDIENIFAFFQKLAEHYGTTFMVRVPYTCAKQDDESGLITTSEEPSTEGGWTEEASIIGLTHPSAVTDFFAVDEGKIGPFVRFDNGVTNCETQDLDPNEFGELGNDIYLKAEIEPNFVYTNVNTLCSPRAVIKINRMKKKDDLDVRAAIAGLVNFQVNMNGKTIPEIKAWLEKGVDATMINLPYENELLMPNAAVIPIKSNTLTYGPWVTSGPVGNIVVEHDSEFTPWKYGSVDEMNTAAGLKSSEGVTAMQVGELGSINVPGMPSIPLGAELGANSSNFFVGGTSLVENRNVILNEFNETPVNQNSANNYSYASYTYGQWSGLYGPNISNISIDLGEQGVSTNYRFRTFAPAAGRFSKQRSEALSQIAKNNIKTRREFRLALLNGFKVLNVLIKGGKITGKRAKDILRQQGGKTPHDVFVGQIYDWDKQDQDDAEYKRSVVVSKPLWETVFNMGDSYSSLAFMSLDGLLRPVSIAGDGDLPMFTAAEGSLCVSVGPKTAQPPVESEGYGTLYSLPITQSYLNPLSNPDSELAQRSDTPEVGHDFDVLGRDATPPEGGLIMPKAGGELDDSPFNADRSDYASDYRFLALKGPLMLTGWGYDLDGKPIPNSADSETYTSVGSFEATNLTDKFMDNWLRKPHSWPTGPVDLRWDRGRGCWVAPTPFRMLPVLVGATDIEIDAEGDASLTTGPTLYGPEGESVDIDDASVTLTNSFGYLPATSKTIAYYDTYDCKYYPLAAPQPQWYHQQCGGSLTLKADRNVGQVILNSGLVSNFIPNSTNNALYIGMDFGFVSSSDVATGSISTRTFKDTIKIGKGLKLQTDGSCGALISLPCTLGYQTVIPVVTGVVCSGSTLYVYSKTLTFDECGMLISVA